MAANPAHVTILNDLDTLRHILRSNTQLVKRLLRRVSGRISTEHEQREATG